ncbi:HEPN domain-containing protein [Truepera radiovictrix]|uniref:HEPN domain-containing protein n=1 Tax=Truepera radiovictrix TaxID=332249 RepID=UPI0005A4F357|nr:HEPN domain-containing protein [Truepera radiovictrix]
MERSLDWWSQARRDLSHARADVDAAYYEWACFSAQQAAEKGLKAVFQALGAVVWGHSVADLLRELGKHQRVPPELDDAALELDKAYIPTRYPDAHPSGYPGGRYVKTEALRLVAHAEAILEFCSGFLPSVDGGDADRDA